MKFFWIILITGILIRLLLALTTFHPDLQVFNLAGEIVASGNILNLYDYQSSLPSTDPIKNLAVLNYPPSIYLFHGFFNFLFNDILKLSVLNQYLLDNPSNYGDILFNIHLLLLKLPYLIFDLSIGFILFKLFDSAKKSLIAFTLWMFNPVNLYSTYMMGQFDVIPTFFSILSIYLVAKNKLKWSALALGVGIAFKIFPLFLVIPLVILGKNIWEKFKLLIITLLPYLLLITPYLSSHYFRATALFANQNTKSLYANVALSGGESIILFPTFLIFFYLILWVNKTKVALWKNYLIVLLMFFIFTHYHSQWLIWVTPFLVIELVSQDFKNILPTILILTSFIGSLFFFDPSLTVGIFAPLIPALHNLPSIWIMLNLKPDYNLLRSLLQTVFAAASFYLIYQNLPKKSNE